MQPRILTGQSKGFQNSSYVFRGLEACLNVFIWELLHVNNEKCQEPLLLCGELCELQNKYFMCTISNK